jgi:drug/metabolite transporter (DMT)-like permease
VQTLPPFLAAGLRFLVAGLLLGAWLAARHGRGAFRIDRAQLGGAALVGFAGVAFLVIPRGVSGGVDPVGLLTLVGATFFWALGTFASPRLRTPRDPLASTAVQMLAGSALLLLLAVVFGEPLRADPSRFSTASLAAMAYLVVFGSLLAFSAYTWLLQHTSVSVVATYAYVNPVVAVALGSVVLSEPLTPSMLIGAAIILGAVAFIVSRGATRPA